MIEPRIITIRALIFDADAPLFRLQNIRRRELVDLSETNEL
jgi:hypothetical protein